MSIKGVSPGFTNILGEGTGPDWKNNRYPIIANGANTYDKMKEGYLVKFNATRDKVTPALAADDALICGIIVGLPGPEEPSNNKTVAIAQQGTFNFNQVHYGDAWTAVPPTPPTALSVAARERLAQLNIFLDPAIPAGPLMP